MSGSNFVRINYDTWGIQMEALLIKNDAWAYVNGEISKPENKNDAKSLNAMKQWITNDN